MNKTLKEFINRREVKLFLTQIAGERTPDIMNNLLDPISDEDLAKKLGMRAPDVRMILNKLHYMELIDYNRSKDKERGWYYYHWFVRPDKIYNTYISKRKRDLEDLEEKIENSEVYAVYICKKCDETYDFDRASELLYHCPLCESILDIGISENDIKRMGRIAKRIRAELELVENKYNKLKDLKYESMKVL